MVSDFRDLGKPSVFYACKANERANPESPVVRDKQAVDVLVRERLAVGRDSEYRELDFNENWETSGISLSAAVQPAVNANRDFMAPR